MAEQLPVDPDVPVSPAAPVWGLALVVAAGGALGGGAREGLNLWLPHAEFPWPTMVANVLGCLLIGVLMVFVTRGPVHRYLRPFLGVGVLGGFTTFSAYAVESVGLVDEGRSGVALVYLFGSLVAGLFATWVGLALTRRAIGAVR